VLCRECLSRQPLADIAVGGGSGSAIKLARRCRICSRFASFAPPQRWERETARRERERMRKTSREWEGGRESKSKSAITRAREYTCKRKWRRKRER
jgi:hypothetical protein